MKLNKILCLAPHGDDEYTCSGTLSRFIEEGKEIFYAAFAFYEGPAPKNSWATKITETRTALKILGIKDENSSLFNFPVRRLDEHKQTILDTLINLKNKIVPDLVLVPALSDIHQDHRMITEGALRAFRYSSIFGYESIRNIIASQHICYIKFEERHLDKKLAVFKCYKSQSTRIYWDEAYLKDLARIRGIQIAEKYAEVFEVIKLRL